MEHSVRFSADGSSPVFSDRSQWLHPKLWQLPLTGGEARQVTDLPLDVQGFLLSADEKKLVLTLDVVPGCKDLACTVDFDKKQVERKDSAMVYDQLMVRHWDSFEDQKKVHLFVADLNGNKVTNAKDLMPEWNTDVAG